MAFHNKRHTYSNEKDKAKSHEKESVETIQNGEGLEERFEDS